MNILFYLTPKSEVAYLYDTDTLRQALEKMEYHRYTAIPIIGREDGRYLGTLTEGDLLRSIKSEKDMSLLLTEDISIMLLPRSRDNEPAEVKADMEDLIGKAMNQNFVPVTDDDGRFIGLITRKDIIKYLDRKLTVCQTLAETQTVTNLELENRMRIRNV